MGAASANDSRVMRVKAHVNLQALKHNYNRVRQIACQAKVMAVVKADGYGHGMCRVAQTLADADAFGVASLAEALILREAGVQQSIVLLSGFFHESELSVISRQRVDVVIHSAIQIEALEKNTLRDPIRVWLKINTGMNRLGVSPEQVNALLSRLQACSSVIKPINVMTHFSSADETSNPRTQQQIDCFHRTTLQCPGAKTLANSAAVIAWPEAHGDWVRPGLMLYGVSPFNDSIAEQHGLQPVLTLRSFLIAINNCKKGDPIGYGGCWVCPEDMPVGVVAIGYGDGYPRHALSGTPVLLKGKRVALIGRVSMDSICVDLREQPHATIGDKVTLWGAGLPIESIAQHSSTISYELLCQLTSRVEFEYTD